MSETLDRELLKDLGFERGKGWDHEVWVYEGMLWLHYGNYDEERWLTNSKTHFDGLSLSRKELFQTVIEAVRRDEYESTAELTEDW
jgi:hypothetical protein